MGYDTVKQFSANRKTKTITLTAVSSNSYDMYGRREQTEHCFTYDNMADFESRLLGLAEAYLGGTVRFYPSSTFAKRVKALVGKGLVKNYTITDTQEARDILTGKIKVKQEKPSLMMVNETGYVLKITRTGIILNWIGFNLTDEDYAKVSGRKATRLTQEQAEAILATHKTFLDRHNMRTITIA